MPSKKIQKEKKSSGKRALTGRPPKPSKDNLERLVEEATVDAYGESEQACGFYTMLENDLELPFNTVVLGAEVTVERLDLTDNDQIVVMCRRRTGKERQRLPILDLPLPDPPPTDGSGSRRTGTGPGRFLQPRT